MADFPLKSHFFTEVAKLQPQNASTQAFGPTSIPTGGTTNNSFRLTSKFTVPTSATAYAICRGNVLLQPQDGSSNQTKVNLILKPMDQPIPGISIKYFVYRGLLKSDFLENNIIKPKNGNATSDFINKINDDFESFYADSEDRPTTFPASFIGYDPSKTTGTLADYFFKKSEQQSGSNETNPFELPIIEMGKSLGNFSGECGIDIVLNYGDYTTLYDNENFVFDLNIYCIIHGKIKKYCKVLF